MEGKLHQLFRAVLPQVFIIFINHRILNVFCTWQGVYGVDCNIQQLFCPVKVTAFLISSPYIWFYMCNPNRRNNPKIWVSLNLDLLGLLVEETKTLQSLRKVNGLDRTNELLHSVTLSTTEFCLQQFNIIMWYNQQVMQFFGDLDIRTFIGQNKSVELDWSC